MSYIISRTAYFTPKQRGGAYETRYLTVVDLWEPDKNMARKFTRYPTSTIKKLQAQGIEDAEVIEILTPEEEAERLGQFPNPEPEAETAQSQVVNTPNMQLKLRVPTPKRLQASEDQTDLEIESAQRPKPQPVRRDRVLTRFDEVAPVTGGPQRGYVHLGRANNGSERLESMKCKDAVSFTYYYPSGQDLGQIFVCWYALKDGRVMPSLEAFGDTWIALRYMLDVVQAVANIDFNGFTPADLCSMLEDLGFRDMTA
ncbi:hypothetical protein [Anthocerotibacter panamensis]|uniref:hypothetical protein n=1 Tax=Anthocerotibacter panamensis TaxID=2857077 RepID=UPI001C4084A2|nr:hypothetical protein [Anthocerotibacter panamensis]